MPSANILNAILGTPNLDPRLAAGLQQLRDSTPPNATDLAFFSAAQTKGEATFGAITFDPDSQVSASGALLDLFNAYRQRVTLGGGVVSGNPVASGQPITLDFPNLTTSATGQVVSGHLTVNLFQYDAAISGPINTKTTLSVDQTQVGHGQSVTLSASVAGNSVDGPSQPTISLLRRLYDARLRDSRGGRQGCVDHPAAFLRKSLVLRHVRRR